MEIYQFEKLTVYNKCQRCGYEWLAKDRIPGHCPNPNCNSPYWRVPRKRAIAGTSPEKSAWYMGLLSDVMIFPDSDHIRRVRNYAHKRENIFWIFLVFSIFKKYELCAYALKWSIYSEYIGSPTYRNFQQSLKNSSDVHFYTPMFVLAQCTHTNTTMHQKRDCTI